MYDATEKLSFVELTAAWHALRVSNLPSGWIVGWHLVGELHFFALHHLDVVLYTDLDVLMDPPGDPPPDKWLRWWHAGIHSFVKGPALVAGVPDHEAPLNSASLLIKPSAVAYEASLRIFDNITFNRTTGFNGIGTPRALIDKLSDEKLSLLGVGFGENMTNISKVHDNIKRRLQRTAA